MPAPAAAAAIRVGGKLIKKGTKAYKEYKKKQARNKTLTKEANATKVNKDVMKDRAHKTPKKPQATKKGKGTGMATATAPKLRTGKYHSAKATGARRPNARKGK